MTEADKPQTFSALSPETDVYKRQINSREVLEYIAAYCDREGLRLFNQAIKNSVRITEAPNTGTPVVNLFPDLEGSLAYRQLAQEIIHG